MCEVHVDRFTGVDSCRDIWPEELRWLETNRFNRKTHTASIDGEIILENQALPVNDSCVPAADARFEGESDKKKRS